MNLIETTQLDQRDKNILMTSLSGAGGIARSSCAIHADYFKTFGKITFDRAVQMVEIFSHAFLTRFLAQLTRLGYPVGEAWENLTVLLLQLIETPRPGRLTECRFMKAQFEHGREPIGPDENVMRWSIEEELVLCLAARVLGGEFHWNLRQNQPVLLTH